MSRESERAIAPRFGIGEWYGRSFVRLSAAERRELARIALTHDRTTDVTCPFRASDGGARCVKKGGVCSLRLFQTSDHVTCEPVSGPEGDLRAVCPHRFKQDGLIYRTIGRVVLGSSEPRVVDEVRFLQRPGRAAGTPQTETVSGTEVMDDGVGREDVGNIDNVLVHPTAEPLRWCAMEIQSVYFSGRGMTSLFRSIAEHSGTGIPFPDAIRRPDYRSSGPKRLMPQLQIKVPTLRRWGKKMAVVVDAGFYRNLGRMERVGDLSSADIAWFVLRYDESADPARLVVDGPFLQTLERAVEGLTGGTPVTLPEFEDKIREKLRT